MKNNMELKIINETENSLFKRKEIKSEINSDSTPSTQEILKALSEKFSVPEDAIKVKGIHGKYGSKTFEITANVYSSIEDKEKTEVKTKQEKESEKKAEEDKIQAEKEAKETAKAEEEAKKAEVEKPKEESPAEEPVQEESKEKEKKE